MLEYDIANAKHGATLTFKNQIYDFKGQWVYGNAWERFGLYNKYVVLRDDGEIFKLNAHAGELAPGSTEDLVKTIMRLDLDSCQLNAPLTIELDPTYTCYSKDCGSHCFSAEYRLENPRLSIPTNTIEDILNTFSDAGGLIVRFDGGGDPLAHKDVRNGYLVALAHKLGLKTTILTSGDALTSTNLELLGASNCYLRISLNAATDKTRQIFHGNKSSVTKIFNQISSFSQWLKVNNPTLPIATTYLLSDKNYSEVYDCALQAKEAGFNHFSVRRILGPDSLRSNFSEDQLEEIDAQFEKIKNISDNTFRSFLPWRNLNQPDLNPSANDFIAATCWQSIFKVIIEPSHEKNYRAQLCGRYRGGGIGQKMQLPALLESNDGLDWLSLWQDSFLKYKYKRSELPFTCISCIDRGFIKMIDNLISFLGNTKNDFEILHLYEE